MHHDFLDKFSRMTSPVHRLPASLKTAVAFIMIASVVLLPVRWIYPVLGAAVILLGTLLFSRIPVGFLMKRLLLFEPFVIVIALIALLQPGGSEKFLSIVVKSTISIVAVILLSNTTSFSDLLRLLRQAHMPPIIITILALMYRYLFVLIDELEHIQVARRSRTFRKETARSWFVRSTILGQLFLRSTERAERIYAAMCARGWK